MQFTVLGTAGAVETRDTRKGPVVFLCSLQGQGAINLKFQEGQCSGENGGMLLGQPLRDLGEVMKVTGCVLGTGGPRVGRWSELGPPQSGGNLGDDLFMCLGFLLIPPHGTDIGVD